MSSVQVFVHDPDAGTLKEGAEELLYSLPSTEGAFVWVRFVDAPLEAERRLLIERFNLSPLAVRDAQRKRHPPKLEVFDDHLFIILRDVISEPDLDPRRAELALFIGTDYLISRQAGAAPALDEAWDLVRQDAAIVRKGSAHLVYLISQKIVDHYTPVVLGLEERLGNLEDEIFERPSDKTIERLSQHNRLLKRLRRHLTYQTEVMRKLSNPSASLPVTVNRREFTDIFENLERLASLAALNQELAVELLNTHLSLVSHRLNKVMRVLTITTVIFLPLGLLAGIYGMNFQFMPELSWRWGYFTVLSAMAALVISMVIVFKLKRWL